MLHVHEMEHVEDANHMCCMQVNDAVRKVVAGDARNVLYDAVRKHKASVLVSRNRGYGVLIRCVYLIKQYSLLTKMQSS